MHSQTAKILSIQPVRLRARNDQVEQHLHTSTHVPTTDSADKVTNVLADDIRRIIAPSGEVFVATVDAPQVHNGNVFLPQQQLDTEQKRYLWQQLSQFGKAYVDV